MLEFILLMIVGWICIGLACAIYNVRAGDEKRWWHNTNHKWW